jgi:hypothetical protein
VIFIIWTSPSIVIFFWTAAWCSASTIHYTRNDWKNVYILSVNIFWYF